jgi:hypothetical protein
MTKTSTASPVECLLVFMSSTAGRAKRDFRYDEQIHGGDAVGMIAKERPPALGWRVSSLGHVLGHAGLSDIDAELEESMDPRRSPLRIGNAHLANKLAYLRQLVGRHGARTSTARTI